jgi:triosephosphate isomerase
VSAEGVRPLLFAANWKMHHGPAAARSFAQRFLAQADERPGRRLWFFVPAVTLSAAAESFGGRGDIRVGAQNAHWEPKGAYTGEISIPLAREAGATALLIGHSERRHLFGETEAQTGRKLGAALSAGIVPVLCVGETLAEREAGRTEAIVLRQLAGALDPVDAALLGPLVIAYEPVWAIGTGKNATPDDAAQVHRLIRIELRRRGAGDQIPILYGGSVNLGNVAGLLERPEIEGVLVGGASLDPDTWAAIVATGTRH